MTNRFDFGRLLRVAAMATIVPLAALGLWQSAANAEGVLPVVTPAPAVDATEAGSEAVAVFAGGCFWGVQGVFQHVKGVKMAVSGYAGGTLANPTYEDVLTEQTGHAEAVKVTYDPAQVSYGQLLRIFFSVITDPTTLNRQGNDVGLSYRSALFYMNNAQKAAAEAYIAQLDAAMIYPGKIVTEVTAYSNFFDAEDYHQDNAYTKQVNPIYLAHFDQPKIDDMQKFYPDLWLDRPVLVFAANYS
ncbi:MAG: peptide-methionine (S)-S-oxide reductase MsrA [Devosia sp.]